MQKKISLLHQAVAEFSAQNFVQAIDLLHRAFAGLELAKLSMSDATYNAIFDGVELVELLFNNLPILEKNDFSNNTIDDIKKALEDLRSIELFAFNELLQDFNQLLVGIQVAFSFFYNNNLSIDNNEIGLSVAFSSDGFIELLKSQNNQKIEALVVEFNACFNLEKKSATTFQENVNQLIEQQQYKEAQEALQEMMLAFPETKKEAFRQLADLFFEQQLYREATDAYMKSMVMGTPKNAILKNIQIACNQLIKDAKDSEEAKYWQEFLFLI